MHRYFVHALAAGCMLAAAPAASTDIIARPLGQSRR